MYTHTHTHTHARAHTLSLKLSLIHSKKLQAHWSTDLCNWCPDWVLSVFLLHCFDFFFLPLSPSVLFLVSLWKDYALGMNCTRILSISQVYRHHHYHLPAYMFIMHSNSPVVDFDSLWQLLVGLPCKVTDKEHGLDTNIREVLNHLDAASRICVHVSAHMHTHTHTHTHTHMHAHILTKKASNYPKTTPITNTHTPKKKTKKKREEKNSKRKCWCDKKCSRTVVIMNTFAHWHTLPLF